MKIINILLGILFALFALAQYNDPDSLKWIMVYLFVSILSFLAYKGIHKQMTLVIAMVLILGWLGYLLPGFVNWLQEGMPSITDEMKTTKTHIEVVREFLGLFLAFCALLFLFFQGRGKNEWISG